MKKKQAFIEGINEGYQLGKHYKSISIPLQKQLRFLFRSDYKSAYMDGLRRGFEEGKRSIVSEQVYRRRAEELKALRQSKEQENEQ